MAIHEIRETINTSTPQTGSNGSLILQKRINLQHGMRHTMNHSDFFDDGNLFAALSSATANFAYEFYVSNYPIILQDVTLPGINATTFGPQAGDDAVLFKVRKYSGGFGQTVDEFPNSFLGASPTFSFYTPHLYLTVIIAGDNIEEIQEAVFMSWYAALDSVEVNAVEYGIGMLREYSANQWRVLNSNGVVIDQAEVRGGFPMWQQGGIRPELMTSVATPDTFFYGLGGYGAAEEMDDPLLLRAAVAASRTMVAFDEAFGDNTAGAEAPDWFKLVVRDFPGLNTGPLRAVFPPVLKLQNGNTEMV
jgi:hypothetical protein